MPDPATATPLPAAPSKARIGLLILAGVLAGMVLAAIFLAYLRPGFLMEILDLRYCG